jgi:hypothetical protein
MLTEAQRETPLYDHVEPLESVEQREAAPV